MILQRMQNVPCGFRLSRIGPLITLGGRKSWPSGKEYKNSLVTASLSSWYKSNHLVYRQQELLKYNSFINLYRGSTYTMYVEYHTPSVQTNSIIQVSLEDDLQSWMSVIQSHNNACLGLSTNNLNDHWFEHWFDCRNLICPVPFERKLQPGHARTD